MKPGKPLTRSSPLERKRELRRRVTPLKRSSLKSSRGISPASKAQRAKIAANPYCLACGDERSEWLAIDPAHLVARGAGGCNSADCVVGLCRGAEGYGCHRLFDDGQLDLLSILTARLPAELPELQHMLEHVSPVEMVQRLANARVEWRRTA